MLIRKFFHGWDYFSSLQNCITWKYSWLLFNDGIRFCSHMILEIIMNNPDRNKYMSKSKDTVSVCLIDHVLPESSVLQKFIPESLHRRHPLRRQHRFPGAQLLIFQPSPSQLSQLLQPQFLVGRIPRHVAADTKAAGHGAQIGRAHV